MREAAPPWEFTVVKLPGHGDLIDLIGAVEAKGVRVVALHAAAAGNTVVGLHARHCSKALEHLLPPSACSSVYTTEDLAQQAVHAASGGGASLCPAASDEAALWHTASHPPRPRPPCAAVECTAAAAAALAGTHACAEDSGTHRAVLALLRAQVEHCLVSTALCT